MYFVDCYCRIVDEFVGLIVISILICWIFGNKLFFIKVDYFRIKMKYFDFCIENWVVIREILINKYDVLICYKIVILVSL